MRFILGILIYTIITLNVYSQNDFWADNTNGCVPLLVNFQTNADSSAILYWTFGNGNQSNLSKPQVAYILPGIYDVKLIISKGNTIDTILKKNYITVYPKPVVDFTTTNSKKGCIPLSVSFKDISPNNLVFQEHIWIFGDGQMSNEPSPIHTFENSGNFNVSLKVSDQNGCENSKFINEFIKTSELPIIDFKSSDSILCDKPYNVNFTNLTLNDTSLNYLWNFGNNTSSILINPSIVYSDSGNYDIKLTVTDKIGCSKNITKDNYIKIGSIKANFVLANDTFCKNSEIFFSNTSNNAEKFAWNFGDGNNSILENPTHFFQNSGNYTITLMAENGPNCFSSKTKIINIDSVNASFSTDKHYVCSTPATINYTDLSYNANSWNWKFGNYSSSLSKNPLITIDSLLSNSAMYSDTLIVTSPNNCNDTAIVVNNIEVNLLKAYFTPNNSSAYNQLLKGRIPLNVQFNNNTNYTSQIDSITGFEWNINDVIYNNNLNPYFSFTDDGTFEASLSVQSAVGCRDTFKVSVITGFPQTAGFYLYGSDSACATNPFFFIDTSSSYNYINSWNWNFSDGESEIVNSPSHSFRDTGYCSASLTVGYNGCYSSVFNSQNLIYVNGPIGMFNSTFSCDSPYTYTFNGEIIAATRWYWDFGDGIIDSSFQDTILHKYAESGDYLVKLKSYNDITGCDYYWERLVTVRNPKANLSCDTIVGCQGLNVTFNPDSSKDFSPFTISNVLYNYKWLDNNLHELLYNNGTFSETFNNRGNNYVSLVIKDINNCYDTLTKNIKIYKPIASFTNSTSAGCLPLSITFQNNSVSDTTFSSFWTFGDLTNSSDFSPNHLYNLKDTFNISLKITDTLGCTDSISINNAIRTFKPFPSIKASKVLACIGDTISFSNINHEDSLIYYWTFGDGTISSLSTPIHVYNDTGLYDISLRASYPDGCDSILTMSSLIHIQSYPEIEVSTDTTFSNCYPLMVKFSSYSASHSNLTYNWDFGDNNPAYEQNPSHSFNLPNDYSVSLEVATTNGCRSKIIKDSLIHVGGPYAKINKPSVICRNEEYTFTIDNKINVSNYKWDMGDGTFKYGESVEHTYNIFGKIYPSLILFSDSLMTCDKTIKDSIDIYLTVSEFQLPELGRCKNNTFDITDISVGAEKWNWSIDNDSISNIQNPSVNITEAGNYSLTLVTSDIYGCNDTITKNLVINPLPIVISSNDTLICKGQNISLFALGGIKNEWYLNDSNINNNYAIAEKPDTSSIYNVIVTDEKGCINYDSINVLVQSIPFLYTSKDTTIIIGETVTISATSQLNASFIWEPDLWINCTNCSKTTVKPMESTIYNITASDSSKM